MLLTVPLFAVFGASYSVLRIVPVALAAVAALIVWRIGRRVLSEPAAALAGALMWIWFPENLVHITHQYGFYASDIVYAALLVLLLLRVIEQPTRLRVALVGLTLGLAFWESVQIVPLAAPALAWTAWKQPRALRHAWLAAILAFIGALPWFVFNVRHDWASLMARAGLHDYTHSLRLFASPLLPMTLGLRTPLTGEIAPPGKVVVTLAYALLLALAVAAAVRYRHRRVAFLFAIFFAFPFVWAALASRHLPVRDAPLPDRAHAGDRVARGAARAARRCGRSGCRRGPRALRDQHPAHRRRYESGPPTRHPRRAPGSSAR